MVLWFVSPGCTGHEGAAAPTQGEAAMTASLRMAVLRARQNAAGYDFVNDASGTWRTRAGGYGATADVVATARGVRLEGAAGGFHLGVETTGVGRGTSPRSLGVRSHRAEGQELVLDREDGVEERYLAGPLGLEQSYLVSERPEGTGPLAIEVAFDGLTPEMAAGATDQVRLRDEAGVVRAGYRDLAAVDAAGRELAARMEVRASGVALVIDDTGAAYPVLVDPVVWTQEAELIAPDGAQQDYFGHAVAVSGGTAVVGANLKRVGNNGDQGVAYVFAQSGTTWTLQQELTASDGMQVDEFGGSVAVNGGTIVIGANGHRVGTNNGQGAAYVFVQSGTTWIQQAELTASDGVAYDSFGTSVAVSGGTIVAGASTRKIGNNPYQGAAYVFVQSGATWTQQAELTASDGAQSDNFGSAVAVSGGTAIVGVSKHAVGTQAHQGAAYVFAQSGTTWALQQELTAGDGAGGDFFGYSVAVSGGTVIVGAYNHQVGNQTQEGAAYVFTQSGTTWTLQQELTGSDSQSGDVFGKSVAMDSGIAVVGGKLGTYLQGAAYVFVQSGTTWTQQAELRASDGGHNDFFGCAVGVSGGTAVVGAIGQGIYYQGAAYVFGAVTDCLIGGVLYAPGTLNPVDTCQVCTPATSTTAWTTLSDGATCDDGNACTQGDACQAGVCTGASSVVCTASDQCHGAGTCNPSTGCSNPSLPDGTTCNDGNACTQIDACKAGVCTGSSPVICTGSDQCHPAGTCNPGTGVCSTPNAADGTACDDGNPCTVTDKCESGVCTGSNTVMCESGDPCHVAGTCNPSTGYCSTPNAPDGTGCDDGNICTQTDTCLAGVCVGSNLYYCAPIDACHVAGVCDPSTFACSTPSAPDGTACDDSNVCTQTDTCQAGVCTGSNPVTCTASDPCHTAGTCDPGTGTCSNPNAADGTACNDGNACTQTDTCLAGVCTGLSPVTCTASDECHLAGVCQNATGACSNPAKPDGAACSLGTCQTGTCTPASDGGSGTGGGSTTVGSGTGGGSTTVGSGTGGSSATVGSGTGGSGTGGNSATVGSGTGGSSATVGSGTGGSSATVGSGTGGSSATVGSGSTASGSPAPAAPSGCGCRVAGDEGEREGKGPLLALGAFAMAVASRKRRGSSRRRDRG